MDKLAVKLFNITTIVHLAYTWYAYQIVYSVGTAVDIVPVSKQMLVFSDSSPKVVTVSISNDKILEMDEIFFANLSVSTTERGVVLNPSAATILIENDDGKLFV